MSEVVAEYSVDSYPNACWVSVKFDGTEVISTNVRSEDLTEAVATFKTVVFDIHFNENTRHLWSLEVQTVNAHIQEPFDRNQFFLKLQENADLNYIRNSNFYVTVD